MIVALMCVTQVTCFGMNHGTRVRLEYGDGRSAWDYANLLKRSIEVQERQADFQERQAKAQESIAQSIALLIASQNEAASDQKAKL